MWVFIMMAFYFCILSLIDCALSLLDGKYPSRRVRGYCWAKFPVGFGFKGVLVGKFSFDDAVWGSQCCNLCILYAVAEPVME